MKMVLINNIRKKFMDALNELKGEYRGGRDKRGRSACTFKSRFKLPQMKELLGQKRTVLKAKGSVNTDTRIFNKPRKDESHGRQN